MLSARWVLRSARHVRATSTRPVIAPHKPRAVKPGAHGNLQPLPGRASADARTRRILVGGTLVAVGAGIGSALWNGPGTVRENAADMWHSAAAVVSAIPSWFAHEPVDEADMRAMLTVALPSDPGSIKASSGRQMKRPTIVLPWEALVQTPYDPQRGYLVSLRPGFIDFILMLGDIGYGMYCTTSAHRSLAL